MSNWKDYQRRIRSMNPSRLTFSELGATTPEDYFQVLLAAFVQFGKAARFPPSDIPQSVLKELQRGVFPKTYLGGISDTAPGYIRFGTGEIESFVSWGTQAVACLETVFQEVADEKSHRDQTPRAKTTRLLIVDDSSTIHNLMKRWVERYSDIEIVGNAYSAEEAEPLRLALQPSVVVLDIHMPGMDGLTYLQKIMSHATPSRVVLFSSIRREHAVGVLQALSMGAVDYIEKPELSKMTRIGELMASVFRAAAKAQLRSSHLNDGSAIDTLQSVENPDSKLILIGASTGGTEAIKVLLQQFPENCPPTLIVQHIPPIFSAAFAQRLNELVKPHVEEAKSGMPILSGNVYIAPGGKQMTMKKGRDGTWQIQISEDDSDSLHKPSVDYLFQSIADDKPASKKIVAALLTGMGSDGSRGMKALRDRKVHTIAQDEDTCVIFGMPRIAISLGAAEEILPLPSIPYHLFKALK